MCTLIRHEVRKARKDYSCQASEFYLDCGPDGLSISDLRIIVKARKNNYKIKKGELHDYCFMKNHDNEIYSFRSIIGMNDICLKYEMYPDC